MNKTVDKRVQALLETRNRCKEQGIHLGRQKGKEYPKKLDPLKLKIEEMLCLGCSMSAVAKELGVSWITVKKFVVKNNLQECNLASNKAAMYKTLDSNEQFIRENYSKLSAYSLCKMLNVSAYYFKMYCTEKGIE